MPDFVNLNCFQRLPALMGGRDLTPLLGSVSVARFLLLVGSCPRAVLLWGLGVCPIVNDVSGCPPFVRDGYGFFVSQWHSADFGLGLLFCCLSDFRALNASGKAV